ncbi:MAG TPA: iron chelate uptake ABC transporter family permease subunit, partial [Devosiaceae bacterium]|nr:iron chelate uptake ABC transporter family permease subunit [Devosiaceae bacterium]
MKRFVVLILAVVVAAGVALADEPAPSVRPDAPRPRIVSFAPAITQILFDMGLGDHVVGVTDLCILPEGVKREKVGDALTVNSRSILAVRPDLIVAQIDPSRFGGVLAVDPGVKVVELTIMTISDVAAAIDRIGELCGQPERAMQYRVGFDARIDYVRRKVANLPRPRVMFVMGTERPSAAGAGSFMADLIEIAGGANAGADIAPGEWISTHLGAIRKAAPDILFCQGTFGRQKADLAYWQKNAADMPAVRSARVYAVSDRRWSIPSTYTAELALEMARMIHPEAFSESVPVAAHGAAGLPAWLVTFYRLLAAAVVGAALAAAGTALQGLLRNPLAEPFILGVSSGAGVGVLMGMAVTAWTVRPAPGGAEIAAIPEWLSTPTLAF